MTLARWYGLKSVFLGAVETGRPQSIDMRMNRLNSSGGPIIKLHGTGKHRFGSTHRLASSLTRLINLCSASTGLRGKSGTSS